MKNKIRIGLIILSLVFIFVGGVRGEINRVFTKAANICLECMGIG
jgi:hypothetical protein